MSTAMYSAPVMAPVAAPAIGVAPAAVGFFVALAYLGAMLGTATAGDWVKRFGPMRVSQMGLALCLAGLGVAATGWLPAVCAGAFLIGLGYGPATPASSVILARASPPGMISLTFSIKQTGVPLGTAIAGALIPTLILLMGWQGAAIAVGFGCAALAIAVSPIRETYDHERNPAARLSVRSAFASVALVLRDRALTEMALVSLIYAGVQITLMAYLVSFLAGSFALSLVLAGMIMAASQLTSVAARIVWGIFADRVATRRFTLGMLGVGMGATASIALAAAPDWPLWALFAFAMAFGATAVGWNGVFLAEVARLAPKDRISDATGGAGFFTFLGVVIAPPAFNVVLQMTQSYGATYAIFGVPAAIAGVRLLATAKMRA